MNWLRSAGIAFGLAAFSVAAASQEIPNLVGTWKGTAYAVHVGLTPHRPGEANTTIFRQTQLNSLIRSRSSMATASPESRPAGEPKKR
jgi:hypothetical protein